MDSPPATPETLAGPFEITRNQYLADRNGKTRGTANPSLMDKPFWKYMIGTGCNAYEARRLFQCDEHRFADEEYDNMKSPDWPMSPVWCFHRFGATVNILPDGRHIYIGGEHEDYYDLDFCIYNGATEDTRIERHYSFSAGTISGVRSYSPQSALVALPTLSSNHVTNNPYNVDVIVLENLPPPGLMMQHELEDDNEDHLDSSQPRVASPENIMIYGYPTDIFPPTDFHTSTYFRDPTSGKEVIFIIGNLGYKDSISRAQTNVYQLDLRDFSIQRLETCGTRPPWGISRHSAELVEGIEPTVKVTTEEGHIFSLDFRTLEWIYQ